eukprot:138626-Chlamydomonas_euryale.AAC.9
MAVGRSAHRRLAATCEMAHSCKVATYQLELSSQGATYQTELSSQSATDQLDLSSQSAHYQLELNSHASTYQLELSSQPGIQEQANCSLVTLGMPLQCNLDATRWAGQNCPAAVRKPPQRRSRPVCSEAGDLQRPAEWLGERCAAVWGSPGTLQPASVRRQPRAGQRPAAALLHRLAHSVALLAWWCCAVSLLRLPAGAGARRYTPGPELWGSPGRRAESVAQAKAVVEGIDMSEVSWQSSVGRQPRV